MTNKLNSAAATRTPTKEPVTRKEINTASQVEQEKMIPNYTIAKLLEEFKEEDEGITQDQWDIIRKAAGVQIDPDTAEIIVLYRRELLLEGEMPGRGFAEEEWFARNPGGEWVSFSDLPESTLEALDGREAI